MKYRVIDGFLNSKTQEYIPVGTTLTDSEPRIKDFIAAHVVVAIEDEQDETVELTTTQIKQILDEKGIEYDKKAKKDELLRLLEGLE
jgi:hypothetical protein|nr:MAG TPA: dimeris T4 recombination endonuclease VII [Caudoviricetes sp.]